MPTVVREAADHGQATIHITIHNSDYQGKYSEETRKLQQKVELKGFRKGKAPASLVTKMYGRGILVDIINTLVQDTLFDYLEQEKIPILGQPLRNLTQEFYAFDPKDARDYLFKFDVGLAPEFELQGLDPGSVFTVPVPEIPDEMVEEESNHLRNTYKVKEEVLPPYEDQDLLSFTATEGNVDGGIKENGLESRFSVIFGDLTDEAKESLRNLEPGDAIFMDVFALEKDRDRDFVAKYLLQTELKEDQEVGPIFHLALDRATRSSPSALDQTLYDQVFGEDVVHSEEEYRKIIRDNIAASFSGKSNALFYRDIQKFLVEQNPLSLPDTFLHRWIIETNEKADAAVIDREYPLFANNLKWTILRNKIIQLHGLEVTEQDVQGHFQAQIAQYMHMIPGLDTSYIRGMIKRFMEDEKQVEKAVDEIMFSKVLQVLRNNVTIQEEKMSLPDFEALYQKREEEAAAAQKSLLNEEEE